MDNWQATILSIIIGSMIPTVISMILPRAGTVKFGMTLYKLLGGALGQKRATNIGISAGSWSNFLMMVRTTFTDLSFGVYIASREDMAEDVKKTKIDEYLTLHLKLQDPPKDE